MLEFPKNVVIIDKEGHEKAIYTHCFRCTIYKMKLKISRYRFDEAYIRKYDTLHECLTYSPYDYCIEEKTIELNEEDRIEIF